MPAPTPHRASPPVRLRLWVAGLGILFVIWLVLLAMVIGRLAEIGWTWPGAVPTADQRPALPVFALPTPSPPIVVP